MRTKKPRKNVRRRHMDDADDDGADAIVAPDFVLCSRSGVWSETMVSHFELGL